MRLTAAEKEEMSSMVERLGVNKEAANKLVFTRALFTSGINYIMIMVLMDYNPGRSTTHSDGTPYRKRKRICVMKAKSHWNIHHYHQENCHL